MPAPWSTLCGAVLCSSSRTSRDAAVGPSTRGECEALFWRKCITLNMLATGAALGCRKIACWPGTSIIHPLRLVPRLAKQKSLGHSRRTALSEFRHCGGDSIVPYSLQRPSSTASKVVNHASRRLARYGRASYVMAWITLEQSLVKARPGSLTGSCSFRVRFSNRSTRLFSYLRILISSALT